MNKIIQNYDEGDTVWFIDSYLKHEYAEFGKVVAFTKNGDVVVDHLYGMSVFPKQDIFATKEECEKFIYISNIAKELKDKGEVER